MELEIKMFNIFHRDGGELKNVPKYFFVRYLYHLNFYLLKKIHNLNVLFCTLHCYWQIANAVQTT